MDANGTNDRGWPTVVDLKERPSGITAPSTVSVRVRTADPWTVIAVAGEMDARAVPLVADLTGISAAYVVFELRDVTFMDASGLGVLMTAQRKAVRAGGCVRLVAPSIPTRRLMALTRTDHVFLTFGSVDEAISSPVLAWPEPLA